MPAGCSVDAEKCTLSAVARLPSWKSNKQGFSHDQQFGSPSSASGSVASLTRAPCRLVVPAALVAGRASVGLRAGVMRRPDAFRRAGRCRSSERQPFADWRSRDGHEKFRACRQAAESGVAGPLPSFLGRWPPLVRHGRGVFCSGSWASRRAFGLGGRGTDVRHAVVGPPGDFCRTRALRLPESLPGAIRTSGFRRRRA